MKPYNCLRGEICKANEEEIDRLSASPDWTAYNALQNERDDFQSRLSAAEERVKELEAEHQLRYGFEARFKRAEEENERLTLLTREFLVLQSRLSAAEAQVEMLIKDNHDIDLELRRAEAVVEAVRSVADDGTPLDASEARILIRQYEEGR